ncbi:MAG: cytochrome c biogenesis protein CcsA [Chloroflexi bacterium]|nr:cytochrome c biogenesis protein CcsA [Chloroflexota bacterium]
MDGLSLSGQLYWVAVTLYALAAVGFAIALLWQSEALLARATWLVAGTLAPHGAAILLRWAAVGHGPYINRYEVLSSDVWVGLALFLAFQLRFPRLRIIGAAILPVAVLLMGYGALSTDTVESLPPSLRSYWLVIHVSFAKLALGTLLISFGVSAAYLLKARAQAGETPSPFYLRLPGLARLDELAYRFTGLAFVSMAVMILSGSIWAHEAWGNYWSWDAIETWSLATWLLYGMNLHLRTTFRWAGGRAAWLGIASLVFTLLAFKGLAYIVPGAHVQYLAR